MEESLRQEERRQFLPCLTSEEAGNYSPLVLAFAGDAVYELAVRTMLVQKNRARPHELNKVKAKLVNAGAQSAMMETLREFLTDEEMAVYRRGRNAKTDSVAKHASVGDYRRATGFECLMGYLFLSGRKERLIELIGIGLESIGM